MKVKIEIDVEVSPSEKEGIYVCYVPMINSYFGARIEDIPKKTEAFVKSYCND